MKSSMFGQRIQRVSRLRQDADGFWVPAAAGSRRRPSESLNVSARCLVLLSMLISGGGLATAADTPDDAYSYSRLSSFSYYTSGVKKGLLQTETVEPANPKLCVSTTYDYDDAQGRTYGNKTSSSTASCPNADEAAFPTRTSTSVYAQQGTVVAGTRVFVAEGQFPTSVTNAKAHLESRLYDPRFGVVTKLTGPNDLPTTWTYDDLGRKTLEVRADATRTAFYYCILPNNLPNGSPPDLSTNSPGCGSGLITGDGAPADAYAYVHSEPRDSANNKIGAFVRVFADRAGRELRTITESFDGSAQSTGPVATDNVYDLRGVKVMVTGAYFLSTLSANTDGSSALNVTHTEYDALGRPTVVHVADPSGLAGSHDFGGYGARPSARQTFAYAGLTVNVVNDKGQARFEEKNVDGEVIRVRDASGAQIAYQRDAFGNLIKTKDALQNVVTVKYDIRGRKVQLEDPDSGTSRYGYDALGQLLWQQTAKQVAAGTQTTMAYDELGRMTSRTEAEYASSWVYDSCTKGKGKLCQSGTTRGITRSAVYDSLGRPQSSTTTVVAGQGFSTGASFTTGMAYDTNGRVSSQTYPTGLQVGYVYTTNGYLQSATLNTSASLAPLPNSAGQTTPGGNLAAGSLLWAAQRINARGQIELQQLGSGVVTVSTFDASGRVKALRAGVNDSVLNHQYSWDSVNNLMSRIDGNGDTSSGVSTGAVNETFVYGDSLNRLTQYTVNAAGMPGLSRTVDLQYNALGMLLGRSDVGNYTYNVQGVPGAQANTRPHALQTVAYFGGAVTSNSFDANGNLIAASNGKYRTVSYTSFNLPDSSTGIQGPVNGPGYTWQYDENHARIQERQTTTAGTRTTWYLHPDNQGGLGFESEIAVNGTISNRHYINAGGQTIGVLVSTGSVPINPTPNPTGFTLVKVEGWHRDHLGSLVATTDHTGALTARYAYDPFGKRRNLNGSYDASGNLVFDWSNSANAGSDRGFTGHEHLDDVGLVHMNGRIFDPALGTFLQADPFVQDPGNLQNYNRYSYCANNPLTCTDPSGYFSARFLRFMDPLGIKAWVAQTQDGYKFGSFLITYASYWCSYAISICNGAGQAAWAGYAGASGHDQEKIGLRAGVGAAVNQFIGAQIQNRYWNLFAHVAWGCAEARRNEGDCGSGARGALASGLLVSLTPGLNESANKSAWARAVSLAIHAASGGISAVAGGGSFADGARSAAYSYLFNELLHLHDGTAAGRRAAIRLAGYPDGGSTETRGMLQYWASMNSTTLDSFGYEIPLSIEQAAQLRMDSLAVVDSFSSGLTYAGVACMTAVVCAPIAPGFVAGALGVDAFKAATTLNIGTFSIDEAISRAVDFLARKLGIGPVGAQVVKETVQNSPPATAAKDFIDNGVPGRR